MAEVKKARAIIIIEDPELSLVDPVARAWLKQIDTKMQTLNNRTKMHTLDIKELKKQLKDCTK